MKNKNLTYIALGIGAGIVAYYLFCRKKAKTEVQEIVEEQPKVEAPAETKRRGAVGGGGGGISVPAQPMLSKPTYTTPVATTTPINVSVTTTPTTPVTTTTTPVRTEPVVAGEIKLPTPTPTPTPTLRPVLIEEVIEKPIITTKPTPTPTPIPTPTPVVSREEVPYRLQETPLMIEEKPILNTAVRETIAPQITQAQVSRALAFDGSKTMAFEVGDCLNDL